MSHSMFYFSWSKGWREDIRKAVEQFVIGVIYLIYEGNRIRFCPVCESCWQDIHPVQINEGAVTVIGSEIKFGEKISADDALTDISNGEVECKTSKMIILGLSFFNFNNKTQLA